MGTLMLRFVKVGHSWENNSRTLRFSERFRSFLDDHRHATYIILFMLIIVIGCLRIISTYKVFWQTWDEPFHIAAGMEWLDQGQFTYEPYHPPLARVVSAIGPYLNGVRIVENESPWPTIVYVGNTILHSGNEYEKNLTLARLGILPFYIVASLVVGLWAGRLGGNSGSLLAVLLFTSLPPILAHAGFATLDMGAAALSTATLYALTAWLNRPNLIHGFTVGIFAGLTILAKLSAVGFLIVNCLLIMMIYGLYLLRKSKPVEQQIVPTTKTWLASTSVILLLGALTVWGGYRFSVGHLLKFEDRPHEKIDHIVGTQGGLHELAYFVTEKAPVPAPEFLIGVRDFFSRNDQGHLAFFMGDIRTDGWWYYFPVILVFKTPLPFLFLSAAGILIIFKTVYREGGKSLPVFVPALAVVGILFVGLSGSVNNGLRQIISIYPLLAIIASYGAVRWVSARGELQVLKVCIVTLLTLWHLISSFVAHPDYLAYFNELARNRPEEIAVDSDLDWGQDLKRLSTALASRDITEVKIKYNGSAGIDLTKFNLPQTTELQPYQKETGWIAISIFNLTLGTGDAPYDQFQWLRDYEPIEKIGNSIWLYYIQEE